MVKVSIIVSAYNREKYLVQALQDLKEQTLKDIEFIIVDDGAQDKTNDILKKEIEKDKRFQVISCKEDKGPSYARNQALKQAQGDYIGFFDVGDYIPVDYYEVLYKNAIEHSADVCVAGAKRVTSNDLQKKIGLLRQGSIWNKIYAKSLIIDHDLKFEDEAAEILFLLQVMCYAQHIYTTKQTKYSYRFKRNSIRSIKTYGAKHKEAVFLIAIKMQEFAKNHELKTQDREALHSFIKRCFSGGAYGKDFQEKLDCILGEKDKKLSKGEVVILKLWKALHLISTSAYKKRRAVIIFKISDLFDRQWYLLHYPEARSSKLEPESHYYKTGWKLGYNPSAKFDGTNYLKKYDDVKKLSKNPLEHYLLFGQYEKRYLVDAEGKSRILPAAAVIFPQKAQKAQKRFSAKIGGILNAPVRVKEECDQLAAEIEKLESIK